MFWIFIFAYAALIVHGPQFGIVDDARVLDTILAGRRLPWFLEPSIGRFAPLQGQEYNVIAFLGRSPGAFFVCNAVELVAAAWLLVRLGKFGSTSRHAMTPYAVAFCIMVLPGFTESWFRLFIPERNEFLCVGGLLFAYVTFRETKRRTFFFVSLVCAALALFCKETAFVLVGGIGLFDLLLSRDSDPISHRRLLDLSLVFLSGAWLVLYYLVSYRFRGKYLYGARPGSAFHALLHALAANLLHDPLLLLLLALGACLLFLRKGRVDPLLPVCLCTIASLIAAYLTLHMSNNYYLLPAYALVPFVACKMLAEYRWSAAVRNPIVAGVFGTFLVNQAIVGVQQFTLWRTDPQQFQKVLPVLAANIESATEPKQNVFLAGVDAGDSIELYAALGTYLQSRGTSSKKFDLKAAEPVADPVTWMRIVPLLPSREFSFEQSMLPQPVHSHDLVLTVPASTAAARQQVEDPSQYRCIFRTDAWVYPNLTLKRLARSLVTHGRPGIDDRIDPNYALYEKL